MKNGLLILLMSIALLLPPVCGHSETKDLSSVTITSLAATFIKAEEQREQPKSSVKDIDYVMSLYAHTFQVDHAKAGLSFNNKDDLKQLMIDKLEDDIYYLTKTIGTSIVVGNTISMQVVTSAKVSPAWTDRVFEYTSPQLITLEFDEFGLVTYKRIY